MSATSPVLSHDARWPRAGDWPSASAIPVGEAVDLALLGIPTWRTSLSPTSANQTPSAVRAALRYYSEFVSPDHAVGGSAVGGGRLEGGGGAEGGSGGQAGSGGQSDSGGQGGSGGQRGSGGQGSSGAAAQPSSLRFADFGDADEPDGAEGERQARELVAAAAARSKLVVALGGDNALTVPAALGAWGVDVASAGLVTLDAHHDLRDGVSNGSPVRRLVEAGLDGRRIVQVGIADFANSAVYSERARDLGITVVHRDELHRRPMADVMAEALDIAGSLGGPIHVDFDVDVCDRSVAPACPAAVPGGLAAHELRAAARVAGSDHRVRSVDFAEVDATVDAADGRTVRLVALCVLELAAGLAGRIG